MSGEEVSEESLAKDEGMPLRPGLAGAPYIVYVGLGANLGDRRASLRRALRLLSHLEDTRLVCASSFYETPPWGNVAQPPFLNACAALRTRLLPLVLLRAVQRIERALGRVRREHWGPRTIDVDLLLAEGFESALPAASASPRASLRPIAARRDCARAFGAGQGGRRLAGGTLREGHLSQTFLCLLSWKKMKRNVFRIKERLSFHVRTW